MGKKIFMAVNGMLLLLYSFMSMVIYPQTASAASINYDKPRVVLEDFKISDDMVVPGENFDLTLTLKNPSRTHNINSVLLSFSNNIDYVTPIYGQPDQVYVDSIPAGGQKEVTVTLAAAEKITEESIKFQIDATYSDQEKTNNSNTIMIMLPITTTRKFEIQNVSLPEKIYAGDKTRVQVTYKNTGVNDFYNITMYINGENSEKIDQVSLGSLVAGKVSYAEAYVNFTNTGKQKANISFSYEDIEGNKFTTEPYETDFTALENGTRENEAAIFSEPESSVMLNDTVRIVLIASIGILTIIVIVLQRKYKKR
jgi:hypothetical protein